MTGRRARHQAQDQQLLGLDAGSPLARLLADAAAPAQPYELEGLAAALTAFSTRPRRSPVKSTVLAKLLAAKALAATAGAAAVGGVALAAATGSLPVGAQNAAHDLVGAPAASAKPSPSAGATPDATETPEATDSPSPEATESASPEATPSPSMVGLCRAYDAHVGTAPGKALQSAAFTVLITNAGGVDNVKAYCATVLAAAPGGKPTALPTQAQSHAPATHPTGKPATHPTGKPATHPTGAPATHPTGRP